MKVYKPGSIGIHRLFVQPGKDHPESSAWHDKMGHATMFTVEFHNGVAKVDSQLGKYLVDKGYAQKSPLILPASAAA